MSLKPNSRWYTVPNFVQVTAHDSYHLSEGYCVEILEEKTCGRYKKFRVDGDFSQFLAWFGLSTWWLDYTVERNAIKRAAFGDWKRRTRMKYRDGEIVELLGQQLRVSVCSLGISFTTLDSRIEEYNAEAGLITDPEDPKYEDYIKHLRINSSDGTLGICVFKSEAEVDRHLAASNCKIC